jgi:hypothetical protein
MKKQIALCAGLLLAMGAIETARAQVIYPAYPAPRFYPAYPAPRLYPAPGFADGALPPFEIIRIVRASGFTPVSRPVRRGPYYVLLAIDRGGRDMRVAVDARLGEIVNLRPAVAGVPYGPEIGPAPPGVPPAPDLSPPPRAARPTGEDAPASPRTTPGPASPPPPAAATAPAPAPTRSVAAESPELPPLPEAPPLPRPRPKLTSVEAPVATPAEPALAPAVRKPLIGGTAARDKNEPAPIE